MQGGITVSFDIRCLRSDFHEKENTDNVVNVAFPVFAIECEVRPPLESELDAYEEATLKLISIDPFSTNRIAKTLGVTEGLAEQFLFNLSDKKYASKRHNSPWEITEDGKKYLSGVQELLPSDNSKYGYMFKSTISEDFLQYFHEGGIGKIDYSKSTKAKIILNDEKAMFDVNRLSKKYELEQAYRHYLRNCKLESIYRSNKKTLRDTQDAYANLESFDEVDYDEDTPSEDKAITQFPSGKVFVRKLERKVEKLYLQMRIIFSPERPEGFIVESPLDLSGIDNEFFLRQIQRIQLSEEVLLEQEPEQKEPLSKYLKERTVKFGMREPIGQEAKNVFILKQFPILALEKDRYRDIYSNVGNIHELMCQKMPKNKKRYVIMDYHAKLLEALFCKLFKTIEKEVNLNIANLKEENWEDAINPIAENIGLAKHKLFGNAMFKNAKSRLRISKFSPDLGNSLKEKLIILSIIYYHLPSISMSVKKIMTSPDLANFADTIIKLDAIRNAVCHHNEKELSEADYEYYTGHVFDVANRLLESLRKEA
jgi:hypothetical protein